MASVNHTVTLDLDSIVKSRFGEKKIPRFILNWLKKFIHQDHINGYLEKGYRFRKSRNRGPDQGRFNYTYGCSAPGLRAGS